MVGKLFVGQHCNIRARKLGVDGGMAFDSSEIASSNAYDLYTTH